MNLGRGFPVPQGKVVLQNGDIWVPATPEKPDSQRPSNAHSEMLNNQILGENWQDLLGVYTGLLQNEPGNLLPQKLNTSNQGASPYNTMLQYSNSSGLVGLRAGLQSTVAVSPVEAYSGLPQNFNPNGLKGVNGLEHNIQQVELSRLKSFRAMEQKIGNNTVQNLSEIVPQKVNSLAELMSMVSSTQTPNRGTYVRSKPVVVAPRSLAESSQVSYAPAGANIQQNHILLAESGAGGYNIQEMPNGRLSVPYWNNYNLNLPPSSESGEALNAARPFSIVPITPSLQKQSKNYEIIQVPISLTDETSGKELHNKDNAALSQQTEILGREQGESSINVLDKPTEAVLTSPAEKNNFDDGIDLNKTPQQKTPKRRKHRPKVVIEGKPKKTPKPAATKSTPPDGKPTNGKPKRKYVRKNSNKTSTPSAEVIDIVEVSDTEPAQKSCKRALNFESDNGAERKNHGRESDCQAQNNGDGKLPLNLNLDSNNAVWPQLNRSSTSANLDSNNPGWPQLNKPSTSAMMIGHQSSCSKEMQQVQTVNSFVHSSIAVPQESVTWEAMSPTPTTPKGHTLNAIARILNARNASINQVGGTDGHNHMRQRISGSIAQLVNKANSCEPDLHIRRQSTIQTVPRLQDLVDINAVQGSKREHIHTELRQLKTTTIMGSQLCPYGVSFTDQCNNDNRMVQQHTLEKGNTKIEGRFHATAVITTIEDSSGQMGSIRNNNFPTRSTAMPRNVGLTNLNSKGPIISRNSSYEPNKSDRCFTTYQDLMREFQQQHCIPQLQLCAKQTVQRTSNHANAPITSSLCTSVNWNLDSASQRDCKSIPTKEIIISPAPVTLKKRPVGRPRKDQPVDEFHQKKPKNSRSSEHSSKKVKGSQKELKTSLSVDDITNRMEHLHINDDGNAIVPYKGDGAVVPYEEFDMVKKKHSRPRVDLDPETNRLWNLLMGKVGSESETMDTDKQKWWEEERKVFRGRVDSFIARMHLVQGDRRFSKWKGSVVDSVIGVFLTQNVSDHLSSSAFMSLAAKFPLKKSTAIGQSYRENGGRSSVEHHMVRITFPDGTTCDQKFMKELSHNNSSTSYTQSTEYRTENVTNEKRTFLTNDHSRRTEEDIISSQSSSESLVFQASEDIRSSSGSNSEAEDGWNFGKNLGYLSVPEQPERSAALQQHQFQFVPDSLPSVRPVIGHQKFENPAYRQNLGPASSSNGYSHPLTSPPHQNSVLQSSNNYWTNMLMSPENLEEDVPSSLVKESSSSWASANFEVNNGKGIEQSRNNVGLGAGSRFVATQNARQQFQLPPANHAILNKRHELQTGFPNGSPSRNGQHISNCGLGMQGTFQQDSAFQKDPTKSTQASTEQTNDNSKGSGITVVTTEKEQVHSSVKPSHMENSATSNAKKRKAEKEKAEPFDWDILRRQVQSSTGTTERSWETMDSIDFEALKNADVRVISDTIKERGMNNMLAERMKDFLDRVAKDHGRVDLEWLRDVPPDKAKDYLLSIRGLGLKSVECVRLLTLHHLAFPVDTNVGRIAVRLGWVPLQPLPESLQLHLLELYPVLESIQKYLWPRLCKLDQETLYELHYQMITFGKVFCTKREPNCNACPMRAECRHFASAFASARLALPAPGEKQIVSSSAPINTTERSHEIVKPMALPSAESTVAKGVGLERNFEPFVEEPSTPEPPTELLEKDIEDAFYEDPDEIPVIKLNVEEFTSNLQSIIQEKMELGEADMSKALVALSPELASIPVPKLKHVSRLRTEHQVYELPDSHPLLKGMDRREPDDPSPYLLAIWTPGETADSVQPPESTCSSQGGGLCTKSTCFSCSSAREAQAQTVRGTILIPCRTAMRGSFPLNGTYFQVNEVFADHNSSLNPIDVQRSLLWNLPRRTVFFGTSVSTIFKGLSTEGIQYCFWKGFVCVRGFDQKSRAPRPLKARLHLPASKMPKQNE